jgi:hypothetical protein
MKIQNPGRFSAGCKTLGVSSLTYVTNRKDLPAEDEGERESQIGQITSVLGSILTSYSHDGESSSEDHKHHDIQPHEGTSDVNGIGRNGVPVVSDGVVPTEEEDCTDKDRPEDFNEDVR